MAFIIILVVILQKAACLELFKMVEGAAITKNFSLITLSSLPREYRVSFNFMPTTYLNDWASVIHFTIGENLFTYGSRIPAVFVSPLNLLYFASDISGKQNCETYLKTVIPLNKWVEIIMSQTKIANLYKFTVNVANETVYSIENDLPTSFSKVKVFMSNPWYPAQPGFINSLVIVDNPSVELFTMVERTAITRNFSLTTLDNLPTEYKVSFNFMPTTYLNNWASVIHLTTGDNLFTYGSRIPAVFVSPLNLLYFASDISGKQNCDAFSKTVIPLNKWVQVIISQTKFANQYKFIVNVANETVYSLENIFPTNFSNVKVFMSNPWYPPQPGFINSLTIVDNPSDKPVIKIRPSGQLIKTKFLTINTAISYAYETSPIAYNLTWEYMLPYFFKLISQSEVYLHKGSIYTIPGAFVTNNFNQYINITLEMTSCSQRGDFTLEIPVKFSFCDKDGYKWIQYTSFMTSVTTSFISDPENKKNKSVLEESYSRGICWDQLESLIYACLNLYVTTQKTACYVSNNYGEKWTKLDVRVGSVLGYHKLTRDLYVVHRNQKSFLMYHKIHKKWLVVPNKEFEENISKSLNSSACLKIEGTFEQVLTTESLQWMGNNEGLYFRNVFNTTWTRRIEWKELL
nr:uncharacterized protein LOC105847154 isoform X3 [Hydra vulgaris]